MCGFPCATPAWAFRPSIYSISTPQIHRRGRWPRAFNIGFPNAFDRALERTGSLILVHGGCSSIGCFAMTNPQMDEIYKLSELALNHGQARIPVHVFPFRMTEENLAEHADSEWLPFWRNLRDVYEVFERTRLPPSVTVCGKKYVVKPVSQGVRGRGSCRAGSQSAQGRVEDAKGPGEWPQCAPQLRGSAQDTRGGLRREGAQQTGIRRQARAIAQRRRRPL